jgi:hypothetical protein
VPASERTVDAGRSGERELLLAVYHAWQRALRQRDLLPAWLQPAGARGLLTGMAVLLSALLIFIDEALWSVRLFTSVWVPLMPRSGALVLIVLAAAWAAGSWLLGGSLARVTRDSGRFRPWLLGLRGLAAGAPLVGLLVVPAWRRIEQTSPAWALRRVPRRPQLTLLQAADPPRRRSCLPGALVWLVAGDLAALGLATLWAVQRVLDDPSRRREVLLLSLLLHAAGLASALVFLRSAAVGQGAPPWRYRLALATSLCWLVPVPYLPILALPALLAMEPATARSQTLIWKALVRRQGAGRLPLWLGLEDALRQHWGELSLGERLRRPDPARSGHGIQRAQNQVLKLYDLQAAALVFDAAALAWGLSWRSQALWMAPLALCGAATVLAAAHLGALLLRMPARLRALDLHPYATCLARTQLALAAGVFLGVQIELGQAPAAGMLLTTICGLLAVLWASVMMLRLALPKTPLRRERFRDMAHEVALLFALMPVFAVGGAWGILPRLFVAWMVVAPLRALLLGRTLLPWLLRPFSWRDAFAPELPAQVRAALVALTAAALLPGGGLAVPACIWLRHRLWPQAMAADWRRRRGGLAALGPPSVTGAPASGAAPAPAVPPGR